MKKELAKTDQSVITAEKLNQYLDFAGIAKSLTNEEKGMFVEIAQASGLDPFKREIHVSKYGNDFSIVVGYEVYIKRAEATGLLAGWEVRTEGTPDFNNVENSNLKAIVTIWRKDREKAFIWEADFADFAKTTREGRVTQFWKKARFMIKKVAISQAFRLCFNECSGLPYTEYEGEKPFVEIVDEIREDAETVRDAIEMKGEHDTFHEAIIEEAQEVEEIPTPTIKDAEKAIKKANTREEINDVWKQFRTLQTDPEFVSMVKRYGEALKSVETAKS